MKRVGSVMIPILVSVFFSACSTSHVSDKPIDDASITRAVKAKLITVFGPMEARQELQLNRGADQQTISSISVSSVNGVVTLTGEVRGNRAKAKAGEIAKSVEHVVSVNNNLSVAPGYSDDAVGGK
jgi:hypothetical protein